MQEQIVAQEKVIDNLKNDKISLEHELKATETACLQNRDVVNSLKLKSEKLKLELQTLNDENVLLFEKVETLTSSNIVLSESVYVLTLKVNEISTFDEVKKELWKKELVAEKISAENELFKKFIPSKRGLGFVEFPDVPSGSRSHGNVPTFHDKKITRLYENLHNSKGQGIDFQKIKK